MDSTAKQLVSIIITTKNEEKYLEKTLKAVKNQTYNPIEIIVTDACSTDDTVKIARKYADKVIVKKTKIAEGRNLGAKYANGNFLVFINADVIIRKNWIENAIKKFQSRDTVMVIGTFENLEKSIKARIFNLCWNFFRELCFLIGSAHTSGECTLMVRKSTFKKIGGFREDLTAYEDVDLGERIKKLGKIVVERKCKGVASLRRFEKDGYLKWIFIWLITAIWYYLTKRPLFKDYKPVR